MASIRAKCACAIRCPMKILDTLSSIGNGVDTTVQPKAIPTDAKLLHAAIKGLNRLARLPAALALLLRADLIGARGRPLELGLKISFAADLASPRPLLPQGPCRRRRERRPYRIWLQLAPHPRLAEGLVVPHPDSAHTVFTTAQC